MNVKERVASLRKLMQERNIDLYYIPNEDDHLSDEYTAAYFKCKSWISGFTGDYGCVIVSKDFAGLWTDGRHFTQAENELEGSDITLMRMGQEGVPSALQYLKDHTPKNGKLGFDGRVVSASFARSLASALKEKDAVLTVNEDLVGMIWEDRPLMPKGKLFTLAKKYTGESAKERIERVREALKAQKADVLLLTELEDPCWMLNIRGRDLDCTPVAYAFAMVTAKKVVYYVDEEKLSDGVRKALKEADVTIKAYEDFTKDLASLRNKIISVSMDRLNAAFYTALDTSNRILNQPSPVLLFRAMKNKAEIAATRNAHIKDGVAMVKFLYWLKNYDGKGLTEVGVQNKLYEFRAEQEGYICPSFHTICAYKGNAAMMHYTANETTNAKVKKEGFLLVDSGGTYVDGSTDITRTIVMGKLTAEEKKFYTKVLQGNLQLARAKFLYGCNGYNLDILARGPVWDLDIDYQCGTGHGIGHVLSVHEGPHSIRWGARTRGNAIFEEGMIVSDEPGVYLPHKMGIRIENELLCVKGEKNFYGQFMQFENLTYCPIDMEAIDTKYLNKADIDQLNEYHALVYKTLSPFLSAKEKAWLKTATKKIS